MDNRTFMLINSIATVCADEAFKAAAEPAPWFPGVILDGDADYLGSMLGHTPSDDELAEFSRAFEAHWAMRLWLVSLAAETTR